MNKMQSFQMGPTRPYLVRAFYDWIVENGCTPYIVVDVYFKDTVVPIEYAQNGQIVLNISLVAVTFFKMTKTAIEFQARFSGRPQLIYVPYQAILAIYAKENGRGTIFEDETKIPNQEAHSYLVSENPHHSADPNKEPPTGSSKKRPSYLTLVK